MVARNGHVAGTVTNRRKLVSPLVRATPVGPSGRPLIGGINSEGHFELDLPAGVYDITLDDEHQAPLQIVVVENRTTLVQIAAPLWHTDLVVHSNRCTIVTLFGTRPHERLPRTEVGTEVCTDNQVRFYGVPPGTYRTCVDGDDDCETIAIRDKFRVQSISVLH